MVQTGSFHDVSDWLDVKRKIEETAPDIEVRIIDNLAPDPALLDWQVSRPSLVFPRTICWSGDRRAALSMPAFGSASSSRSSGWQAKGCPCLRP